MGLMALIVILVILYTHAALEDRKNGHHLRRIGCPEMAFDIPMGERCRVEQIIREYKERRNLAKSSRKRILRDTTLGAIRGALGGALLGGQMGVVPGTITFAALNGILSWSGANINRVRTFNPKT